MYVCICTFSHIFVQRLYFCHRLTVAENLIFYGCARNPEHIDEEMMEMIISDLGIDRDRNTLAKNLTFSAQRKLTLANAYVGGNKYVLLVNSPVLFY